MVSERFAGAVVVCDAPVRAHINFGHFAVYIFGKNTLHEAIALRKRFPGAHLSQHVPISLRGSISSLVPRYPFKHEIQNFAEARRTPIFGQNWLGQVDVLKDVGCRAMWWFVVLAVLIGGCFREVLARRRRDSNALMKQTMSNIMSIIYIRKNMMSTSCL